MSSKLKVASRFKMVVPAGKATPQPPVGSALGQRGLKLMDFCKAFNDQTAVYKEGTPIPVKVTAYADRTFTFDTFQPHTSYFLKKAAGLDKGAARPGHEAVGRVSVQQVYEIAEVCSPWCPCTVLGETCPLHGSIPRMYRALSCHCALSEPHIPSCRFRASLTPFGFCQCCAGEVAGPQEEKQGPHLTTYARARDRGLGAQYGHIGVQSE